MRHRQHTALSLVGAALMTTAISAPMAQAQSVDELRSQVFALEQRLSAVEKRGGVKVASGTTLEFGGYVKLDFTYDFEQNQGLSIAGGGIVVGGPDDGGFRAHARESRFNVKSTTQTENGPVTALIEFDFFTAGTGNELISNSATPRMRLAYGEWNGIQAGQNWTLFMPIAFGIPQVNFSGPAGQVFMRQSQLRYTFPKMTVPNMGSFTFAASLESSEFNGRIETSPGVFSAPRSFTSTGTTDGLTANIDKLPDFVGAVDWSNGVQRLRGAVVLQQLNSPDSSDDTIGYGVSLAYNTPLWAGSDLRGTFQYGDGIGRYIQINVGNAAVVDSNNNIHSIEAWGTSVGLSQKLTDTLSVTGAYGYFKVEDTFTPNDVDNVQTAALTVFYRPNSKVVFGTEFIWARRENVNNANESTSRLQQSVQFKF